jgi:hypothetical protein
MSRRTASQLYRVARLSNTAGAVTSGKPRHMARRGRNIIIGLALARVASCGRPWRQLSVT